MPYISQNFINDLPNQIDIVDLIAKRIVLKKTGDGYRGACPFHGGKNSNFSVSAQKQFYHCFKCQFMRHGSTMIKAKDSRTLITTLKSGLPIWYAPDQDLGAKHSTFAPFFGVQTATINATAKLAKIDNTVVIPLSFSRNKSGYELEFYRALSDYPSSDALQNATTNNQILQIQILKAPEQYLWIHRRFKTRPEGKASFY
jgi:lauroyl/myristoyl acyltransferase